MGRPRRPAAWNGCCSWSVSPPDGEWERVDGMAACTASLEQMTNGGWWLGHERMLAARNGLDARRLPLPRRPIVC